MKAGDYGSAMDIAKKQIMDSAQVIDINVNNGMLDSVAAIQEFVKITMTDTLVAKVPFMEWMSEL